MKKLEICNKLIYTVSLLSILTSPAFFQNSAFAATGDPLVGLTSTELATFNRGKDLFQQEELAGPASTGGGGGLGPRFNGLSCSSCHEFPAIGGASPPINPQVEAATKFGAVNTVPFFISKNGPIREARIPFFADGTRDGGVTDLYVITGRSDARGCNIPQFNFNEPRVKNSVIFRIPTPLFGTGLLEAISDQAILDNKSANQQRKANLGIGGHENRDSTDGTISRFGWKAQHTALINFSGEAYNVEMGVTNEINPNERDETLGCNFNATPEDKTDFSQPTPILAMSDVLAFRQFMAFLAPPETQLPTQKTQNGARMFKQVGCDMCHTPTFTTSNSISAALRYKPVNAYSDLLLHHMGQELADNVIQSKADVDEFRTAPLWGVGKRLFYLHDGRTSDLQTAIQSHMSRGSEANKVIQNFKQLSRNDQNDLITFLKAL